MQRRILIPALATICLLTVCVTIAQAASAWQLDKVQMVSQTQGWALAHTSRGSVLLKTSDGGRAWRNISPKGIWPLSPEQVQHNQDVGAEGIDAYFLDGQTGWVAMENWGAIKNQPAQITQGQVIVERTRDGGRHWTEARFPENTGFFLRLSFLDTRHGSILTISDMASGSTKKALYRTSDGGRTWKLVTERLALHMDPSGITFRNASQGWITAGYHGDADIPFYRTVDAGQHWRLQKLEMPTTSSYGYGNTYPPRFFGLAKKVGVLPVQFVWHEPEANETAFYVTGDGGATWQKRRAPILESYAMLSARHWLGLDPSGKRLYVTHDGGHTWHQRRLAKQIGGPGCDIALGFVDARNGWALISDVSDETTMLQRTYDKGQHWRVVYPARRKSH